MKIRTRLVGVTVLSAMLFVVLAAPRARAQEALPEVVKEAEQYFPPGTIRIEYSNSAKLRKLPNYATLKQRYLGPELQHLLQSLSKVGIRDDEVDELALGWDGAGSEMALFGLAEGRFDAKGIAARAAAAGIESQPVADHSAWCFSAEMCVVVLTNSRGVFGPPRALESILQAQAGTGVALAPDSRLRTMLSEARPATPIWGVATNAAVADWFRTSMPSQDNMQLDWSQAFSTVEALAYSVDAAEKVSLEVKLDCATPEAANNLHQVLNGLRAFQQLAWQKQHPNEPNPFEAVQVDSAGQRVDLKLTTPYPTA
ncbi:MAG TPA: hypothetical protein VKU44_10515 [Terriglobia bacterium]|nr:hypothetical protein [Terriglobia bacterium]